MANTHSYELKISDNTYEGDLQLTGKGAVGYTQDGKSVLSGRMQELLEGLFEEFAKMYDDPTELEGFEIKVKP